MSMTKKDYIVIANIIKNNIDKGMRLHVGDAFAHKLAQENDKFDIDKFMKECGL